TMYLVYGIYYIFLKLTSGHQNVFLPFIVITFLSEILFIITAFRFAKAYDSRSWMQWFFFLMLLCAGGTVFFFGYMEVYPLQYALILVYFYFAYLYVCKQGKLSYAGAALILSI